MNTPSLPSSSATTSGWGDTGAPVGQMPLAAGDFVLAGRAASSGQFLAGLIAAAELDTVGRPEKLAADLFPDVDPVVVQAVWDRALAVGLRAGQLAGSPRFSRDKLARLQGELRAAGFEAMGMTVGRSLRLVVPEHPADEEASGGREH